MSHSRDNRAGSGLNTGAANHKTNISINDSGRVLGNLKA